MGKERYAFNLPFGGDLGAVATAARADGRFASLAGTDFFMD
jgi:hypothetical protein